MALTRLFLLLLFVGLTGPVGATERIDEAKELFGRYVTLGEAFDPAIADLYDDDALIQNTRVYPTGQVKTRQMPASQYKTFVRMVMPLAKAKGDVSEYSDVTYIPEGNRIRIKATRYSVLKDYSSPISLLVGPDGDDNWVIYEELTQSRP